MTMDAAIEKFFEALEALVDADGTSWVEKRDAILAKAKESEADGIRLGEIISWFEGAEL